MLVIVNPYATTMSDRVRNLVVYALQGRYDVQAVDTQAKGHAIELCREAAHEGYDVVVAFGGDGTVNEAANGLVGSPTPLTCLPGGATNVYGRMLGIPNDVVDATEHLLGLADAWRERRVDLGRLGDRRFVFSAGMGLDASVVERVDSNPRLKARFGPWYFAHSAVRTFLARYVVRPPRLDVEVDDKTLRGVSAFVQNGEAYTYFQSHPIEVASGAALDSGDLSGAVLTRASPVDVPTVAFRALSKRAEIARHRQVEPFSGVAGGRRALGRRPAAAGARRRRPHRRRGRGAVRGRAEGARASSADTTSLAGAAVAPISGRCPISTSSPPLTTTARCWAALSAGSSSPSASSSSSAWLAAPWPGLPPLAARHGPRLVASSPGRLCTTASSARPAPTPARQAAARAEARSADDRASWRTSACTGACAAKASVRGAPLDLELAQRTARDAARPAGRAGRGRMVSRTRTARPGELAARRSPLAVRRSGRAGGPVPTPACAAPRPLAAGRDDAVGVEDRVDRAQAVDRAP